MDTFQDEIQQTPTWIIPKLIAICTELKSQGQILNIDSSDNECIQIVSKLDHDKYRIDNISTLSNSIVYTNKEGVKLYMLASEGLILESIFGSPSPGGQSHTSPPKILIMSELS